MVREPHFDDATLTVVYEALLAHQHHLALTDDPTLYPLRLVTGRALIEVGEALGFEALPLVMPDFDFPPETTYATLSDELWQTGPVQMYEGMD